MRIIGIDPGKHTGMALFENNKLVELVEYSDIEFKKYLQRVKPDVIVFEDSREQSAIWSNKNSPNKSKALVSVSRALGWIDKQCAEIEEFCGKNNIAHFNVSPKSKGKKLDHKSFCSLTGWTGRTNQHKRDAAMVAWPYRNINDFD